MWLEIFGSSSWKKKTAGYDDTFVSGLQEVDLMQIFILDSGGPGLDQVLTWLSGKRYVTEVSVIRNPNAFLERVEWERPDLVIIRLGDRNIPGLKIGRMVKDLESEIKLVFISEANDYPLEDAQELGAHGYLLCPITETKLKELFP